MTRRWGLVGLGAIALTIGCGVPQPHAARSVAQLASYIQAPSASDREVIAPISYRSPRYPFHSERFAFKNGRFFPIDDGMGPNGDTSFFYDGADFYVAVNAAAGSQRAMAQASSGPTPLVLGFGTGPLPARIGDTFAFHTPEGTATLTVTELASGSMRFTGQGGGSGTGEVRFRYHMEP
jgi:hypothetical protein